MSINNNKASVSPIIDTKTDLLTGKGMLGFVVTYSDGMVQNKVLDYTPENYEQVHRKVADLHAKFVANLKTKR